MPDQSKKDRLVGILSNVEELIADTKNHRQKLLTYDSETLVLFENGKLTEFGYELDKQFSIRAHSDVDMCLKNLERQRKVALIKLRELE